MVYNKQVKHLICFSNLVSCGNFVHSVISPVSITNLEFLALLIYRANCLFPFVSCGTASACRNQSHIQQMLALVSSTPDISQLWKRTDSPFSRSAGQCFRQEPIYPYPAFAPITVRFPRSGPPVASSKLPKPVETKHFRPFQISLPSDAVLPISHLRSSFPSASTCRRCR